MASWAGKVCCRSAQHSGTESRFTTCDFGVVVSAVRGGQNSGWEARPVDGEGAAAKTFLTFEAKLEHAEGQATYMDDAQGRFRPGMWVSDELSAAPYPKV